MLNGRRACASKVSRISTKKASEAALFDIASLPVGMAHIATTRETQVRERFFSAGTSPYQRAACARSWDGSSAWETDQRVNSAAPSW